MKRLLHALWIVPALVFGFLCMRADWDVRYVVRVLWHRESSTSDWRWKAGASIPASPAPIPWPEAPACARVAAALAAEGVPALEPYLADGGAVAFAVVQDGAIACEWYGNGGARDEPAMVFSISKTITSLVAARAVGDRLDEPIAHALPELVARDPRFAQVTFASLVDMRSGIAFRDDTSFPWVDRDPPRVYYATDLAATVLERTRIEQPVGHFVYNDYAPNLVGLALERAGRARLQDAPMVSLWAALGAETPARWLVDDRGFAWHESGFVATARDLARVGELVLEGGLVRGRPVGVDFVARSLDPVGRAPVTAFDGTALGYRNGWWVLDDALVAMGRYGQIMVVSPASRTVIVRLGLDRGGAETNIAIARRFVRVARRLAP